jgi:hypothetical protein
MVSPRPAESNLKLLLYIVLVFLTIPGIVSAYGIFSTRYFGKSVFAVDPRAGGMGGATLGVAYGLPDPMNPASLSRVRLAFFGITYRPQITWSRDSNDSQRLASGRLSSIVFSLPIWHGFYAGAGFEQLHSTSYKSYVSEVSEEVGGYTRRFSRTGGVFGGGFSLAYSAMPGVSAGVGWRWLFGGLTEESQVDFESTAYDDTDDELIQEHGGAYPTLGLMISRGGIGLGVYWRGAVDGEGSYLLRTVHSVERTEDYEFRLPTRWGVGCAIGPVSGILVAGDIWRERWSDAHLNGISDGLHDCTSLSLGFEYQLKKEGNARYLPLRIGYRYRPNYYQVTLEDGSESSTPPSDEALTLGTSLFTPKGKGAFHVAAAVGRRGGLFRFDVRERYLELTIGFSASERWTTRTFPGP